jgi:hypothetical protein
MGRGGFQPGMGRGGFGGGFGGAPGGGAGGNQLYVSNVCSFCPVSSAGVTSSVNLWM